MAIVPTVNISNNRKENVKKFFESSLYFSGFEPTKKESEGMYLLVTNKSVLNKAQNEADNLLQFFCVAKVKQQPIKIYTKEKTPTHLQTSLFLCHSFISKHFLNSAPINDFFLVLPIKDQYPFPSLQNQQINLGHYQYPTSPPYLTSLLLHHFFHHQHRNVKYKPKPYQSSPQLQITLPTTS